MTNLNVTQLPLKTDADRACEARRLQQLCLGTLTVAENGASVEDIIPLLEKLYDHSMLLSKKVITM